MVDQFLIGDYRNFVYLITFDGCSIVVDPQPDLEPVQKRMKELGSKLVGVALTHTHWDHVAGLPAIVDQYGDQGEKFPPIYVHELDARRMKSSAEEIRKRFVFVKEGDTIPIGKTKMHVQHTPGHSAGECCYLLDGNPPQLFTGDTVFVGMVGRTDLETGSTAELFDTIERIKKMPPETIFYPGHHYGLTLTTTLARECRESAAFRCATVEELDAVP